MTGEAVHHLTIEFDQWGVHTAVVCPESGCRSDPEAASDECWVKSWADNVDFGDEGYVRGVLTVPIDVTWDGDGPRASIRTEVTS